MKTVLLAIAVFFTTSCFARTQHIVSADTSNLPGDIAQVLKFSETEHDFGKIAYGKPVEFTIDIKNISNASITLQDVRVSCGCTTPKFEKDKSLAPGETTKVTLGFSGYADGKFEKFVTILFSSMLNQQVKFFGETVK